MAAIDPAYSASTDADPTAFVRERDGHREIDLLVKGVHCAGCIARVEGGMTEMPGVRNARLNLSTGRLALSWDGDKSKARDFVRRLAEIGYPATPYAPEESTSAQDAEEKRLLKCMAVAGFATANVMLFSIPVWFGQGEMDEGTKGLMHWLSALIVLPAVAYSGRPFFESAWRALRARRTNMDVPITLGVTLACGLSIYETVWGSGHVYFDAAAMLLFFLLIGRFLDSRLRARAGAAARRLASMQAATANRMDAKGHVEAIPARDVKPGDRLLIAAGEKVPVDAVVAEGESALDTALVTGETVPRDAVPGEKIFSGMVNLSAPLIAVAEARREDSLLAEITRLVEAGEQGRSRYVRLADRAAKLYVPMVHTLAASSAIGWLLFGAEAYTAIIIAISVLIITCPCALALAVPAVQVVATGRLYRSGVLVKSGDALERLSEADLAVFDKTGTLTIGKPQLVNRDAVGEANFQLAARLARTSRHPLSRAVADLAGMGDVASRVSETPGGGLEAMVEGKRVRFGSAAWLGLQTGPDGASEAWLSVEGADPVRFAFADALRPDAAETVSRLRELGLEPVLLSGDREGAVKDVAEALGITHWRAGLKPQEKIDEIEGFRARGHKALMVGDGINDAPALASAHVSVSPAAAADISQAAADLVLQGEGLSAIPDAVVVARAARRRVFENFGLTILYNCIAVPLAVFGFVTPLVAAIAMSGSSMIVTLNALRLARK
ncbi:cadmium-translocating P-type ATPase [Hyphobacterium sp. SN044]|uniref:heavy metal translocating P-type ATPase n=1 Tax=Hyphobacterium sp. SN044 TaxID=2912575 RepID=UPI001F023B86|nr:heavy metal translocating P-type ATPase [Hyphobacterium sp. SN044]MCF8880049.1 cadmium-translocating P-type ATPase [Hyphobacterium sp. SN044]